MPLAQTRTRNRRQYERMALHAVLILNYGLVIIYFVAWIIAYQANLLWRADFTSFYTGWTIVRDGRGADVYDFELQKHYQSLILEGRSFKDGLLPFINPPGVAFLFTLLARLPITNAFLAWTFFLLVLLLWLIRLLIRYTEGWQPVERWLLIGTVVAFPPLFTSFLLGAFSLLIMICFFQIYLDLKRGRQERCALWFLLATIKPQNLVLLGAMLLSSRRWRTLVWASLGGAAMVIVSSLFFGWHIWSVYLVRLQQVSGFFGQYGIYPDLMINFRGALTTLFGQEKGILINQISTLAMAGSIGFVIWLWRGPFRSDTPNFELRMALTLVLASFFNLHLYQQDATLYVIPAILFYDYLRQRDLPRRAYAAFLLSCPVLFLFFEFVLKERLILRGSVIVALLLLLWIGKAWVDSARIRAREENFDVRLIEHTEVKS